MKSRKSHLLAAGVLATATGAAHGAYEKIIDLDGITAGTGNIQAPSFVIDGDTGYFVTSFVGALGPAVTKVEGLGSTNTQSVLADGLSLTAAGARSFGASATGMDLVGDSLIMFDTSSDAIYDIGTSLPNSARQIVSEAELDAYADPSRGNPLFGVSDRTGTYFFESGSDTLATITDPSVLAAELSAADIGAITGGTALNGLTKIGDELFFGAQGAVFAYDVTSGASREVLSSADFDAATGASGGALISNTSMFAAPDGHIYFVDSALDGIFGFDPDDPTGTLEAVLTEAQLNAGPAFDGASNPFIADLGWLNGELAFLVSLDNPVQEGGVYAIPEPSSLALLAIGALTIGCRRRRSA